METNHQLDKVSSDTKSFAVKFLFYFDFLIKTCREENFRAMTLSVYIPSDVRASLWQEDRRGAGEAGWVNQTNEKVGVSQSDWDWPDLVF